MFGFVVVFIFILFFVLIMVVKDEKRHRLIVNGFLILILGGLFLAGFGSLFTGTIEFVKGVMDSADFLLQVIVGVMFMALGGIPLYLHFIVNADAKRRLGKRIKKYPDAPWMWVDHWATKRMVYSGAGPIRFGWFVFLVITSSLVAVSYVNRANILSRMEVSSLEVIAFYSVFGLLLFVCFCALVRLLRGNLRFGTSTLELTTYPGIIGGDLAGTIQTRMKSIPERGYDLELRCGLINLTARTSKQLRDTNRTLCIWSATKNVPREAVRLGREGVLIPVAFSIPAETQESDAWSSDKRISWTLSASSSIGGADYLSQFNVPVFKARTGPRQEEKPFSSSDEHWYGES